MNKLRNSPNCREPLTTAVMTLLLLIVPLFIAPAGADIVTDGSLGAAGPLSGPDFQITADLGQQQGNNLFHSFSRFDIASGESATFSGPASIANIISRVTGGNASTIDGLLRSQISGANLFLLNPAGVLFGPNATLDVSGSLHVSSADYLAFDDDSRFYSTPQVGEVLSTAAFGFIDGNTRDIRIQGTNLMLEEDNTLNLATRAVLHSITLHRLR